MTVEYTYRGEEGERIPRGATRVFVTAEVIRRGAFREHPNIEEVICSEDVEKIEYGAFYRCPCLRKVIMPNVRDVDYDAFHNCPALTDVECDKLERIPEGAFANCKSLRSINLPSARIVSNGAFVRCKALTSAKFGSKLEALEEFAFSRCPSLERITIPMMIVIPYNDIFLGCDKLNQVDLVEGEVLRETAAALHFEKWRNDMIGEIDSINQTLPDAPDGYWVPYPSDDEWDKSRVMREWITRVLRKINHYKAEHNLILDEATAALQHTLPQDIVMNNVLPFLELPPYKFGVVEDEMGDYDIENDESDTIVI